MSIICALLGIHCAIAVPVDQSDNWSHWRYDVENWMACRPLTDIGCLDPGVGRGDPAYAGAPPWHWDGIRLKYSPIDEAPCDDKYCYIPPMPYLKQVCSDPGPGEFSYDGRTFTFYLPELQRYKDVAIVDFLRHGSGVDDTAEPPGCEVS